ncbi:hypothetical protein OG742_43800 [Streptomyces sp. NBC_00828]|uniref:hypothetical protein n=1 Tax=Streptomyces sp. NBC_00828 TaxID=2903678 RepID=UPI003862FB75
MALDSGWLCMPASSSHRDPAQPIDNAEGSPDTPQYHDLFLQPRYTVELAPLEDEEDTFAALPAQPEPRRRGATRSR